MIELLDLRCISKPIDSVYEVVQEKISEHLINNRVSYLYIGIFAGFNCYRLSEDVINQECISELVCNLFEEAKLGSENFKVMSVCVIVE